MLASGATHARQPLIHFLDCADNTESKSPMQRRFLAAVFLTCSATAHRDSSSDKVRRLLRQIDEVAFDCEQTGEMACSIINSL